jgi:hypothetical protein
MNTGRWQSQVSAALVALLAVAIVARATWELLRPLLPALIVTVCVLSMLRLVSGRYRQW